MREYHIPDFSKWKDHDSFEEAFYPPTQRPEGGKVGRTLELIGGESPIEHRASRTPLDHHATLDALSSARSGRFCFALAKGFPATTCRRRPLVPNIQQRK